MIIITKHEQAKENNSIMKKQGKTTPLTALSPPRTLSIYF